MNTESLILAALAARDRAYAPYSSFKVGAALLCTNGRMYTGCNIEDASYAATICAERVAIYRAVSDGNQDFTKIVIIGAHDTETQDVFDYIAPCGICRQVMLEFCNPDTFEVILAKDPDDYKSYRLGELIPYGFSKRNL
ncbi:MAG: cytidine deaminase [Clostridiales Family XIII bacterium]|jgi:cytidine deaminase|nr:cytidine deaminase [Clostridiales Family XIII bacterium]